jgi:hypothetical protein
LATVLYYLNDVAHGGETVFPYANSTHTPKTHPFHYSIIIVIIIVVIIIVICLIVVSIKIVIPYSLGAPEYHQQICKGKTGLRIRPRRGRAVMFYNLFEET